MNDRDLLSGPLARALAVLQHVASHQKSLAVADIAAARSLPLPTAHRLITHLESLGYLKRATGSKRIVVGPALTELGANSLAAAFTRASTHAVLQKACDRIGEQCEITVGRNGYMEYVATAKADMAAGLQFDAGRRGPLHCTSTGKVYLSKLKDTALRKLVMALPLHRYTEKTIVDPEELIRQIKDARVKGCAKSNEEYVTGVVGCAVPILSPKGSLVACLGVSAPMARIPFEQLDDIILLMKETADELAEHILL